MQVDYLIIGQGAAGTILDFLLTEKGKRCLVIDNGHQNASSSVAAGVINPLTGRKYVKSWMIDELVPDVREVYKSLGRLLDKEVYREINVIRSLHNIKEENEWAIKSGLPENEQYCVDPPDEDLFSEFIKIKTAYGELKGFQVYLPIIIKSYKEYLAFHNRIKMEEFSFDNLELENGIYYKGVEAEKIIFAEGYRSKYNPFFSHLAMEPSKGEALTIKIDNPTGINYNKILKHKLTFVPQGNNTFWVGSGYAWDFKDEHPTNVVKEKMIQTLDRILNVPYTVEDHKAAVRPTVLDRRPFIGPHYEFNNMYVFNGFGTKGASLIPFWAKHLVNHLCDNTPLSEDVNPDRKS